MGLDMFLMKKKSFEFEEEDPVIEGFEDHICVSVYFEGIYWRKANAIHKWFVDNVQYGQDNCRSYYVSIGKLVNLLNVINKILNKNGTPEDELPTTEGCCFGSTEYDEFYWEELERTKIELMELLNHPQKNEFYYYYQSSW